MTVAVTIQDAMSKAHINPHCAVEPFDVMTKHHQWAIGKCHTLKSWNKALAHGVPGESWLCFQGSAMVLPSPSRSAGDPWASMSGCPSKLPNRSPHPAPPPYLPPQAPPSCSLTPVAGFGGTCPFKRQCISLTRASLCKSTLLCYTTHLAPHWAAEG